MKEGGNPGISEKKVRTTEHHGFGCEQGAMPTEGDVLALRRLIKEEGDKKGNE